jgi:uncharacterized protein
VVAPADPDLGPQVGPHLGPQGGPQGDARAVPAAGPIAGPVRTCIGCRRRAPQAELVRVTRTADGTLLIGRTRPGRGAWLCRDRFSCVDLAERRRAFARALRGPLRPGAVDDLRAALAADRSSTA